MRQLFAPSSLTTVIIIGCALMAAPLPAAEYYLSPDGDDNATGDRNNPWRTLAKASEAAEAGDMVTLLAGDYPGTLRPVNSGSADAPIVFRAEPRRGARLIGSGDDTHAVLLDEVSHVRIEGLHLQPEPRRGRWILVRDSEYVRIEDCRLEDAGGGMPMEIVRSDQVQVLDSIIHRYEGGNMFRVNTSNRVLVEGNSISRAGHSPFQFFPERSNRWIVVRGNVFHAAWGRNFEHFSTHDLLFEDNIITNAVNSGRSADAQAKCLSERSIFRFNRIFRNWGGPVNGFPYRVRGRDEQTLFFTDVRMYNNVLDDNYQYGMFIHSGSDYVQNVVLTGNVFSRNDRWGGYRQLLLRGGDPETVRALNNVFVADEPGRVGVVQDHDGARSVSEVQSAGWIAEHGLRYEDNLDVIPGFVDADGYNHALADDSPLRNAGRPFTRAVGAGEGTQLPVEDAWYFYDGFGIEGERGDLIVVGETQQPARVVERDGERGLLTLDRSVEWQDADPVSLPWADEAPDIGVYEHGADGRPSVQVAVEPFIAEPGQPVTLRAVLHGELDPAEIRWQLGNDTIAEGAEVTHRYEEEYDYPIRVRVTDVEGNTHRGTGYVVVERPRSPELPLLLTTFDADDEEWWWRWQTYRPQPTRWERILDPDTGRGYMRVEAPEDGARMPCWTQPPGWDIDEFPLVRVRYRIGEGTPASLHLRAFGTAAEATRVAIVAVSPEEGFPEEMRVTDMMLHDDEQWHELEFDARLIRERYPAVQVLEALRLGAWAPNRVTEGHWYEVDMISIGPEE